MRICAALLFVTGAARADPDVTPFGAVVTAGVGTAASDYYDGPNYEPITAIELDLGVRLRKSMLGVHVGFSSGTRQMDSQHLSMHDDEWIYTYRPMQIGFTIHRALHDRVYASGWLGVQSGWRRTECHTFTDYDPPTPPVTTCEPGAGACWTTTSPQSVSGSVATLSS